MKNRFLIPLYALALLFGSCTSIQQNKNTNRSPNFVLIFIDDMGYGDVGVYGATGFETPNLDKLASEGMRFTNFYAAQPVCSASRAGLMTGCYPNRIGITGALFPYDTIGINPNETTIAEMLKDKGYTTAIFGKWHLGHHEKFLPLQNGFDEYVGLPYSNDMWPLDDVGNPYPKGVGRSSFPQLPLLNGNNPVKYLTSLN